MEDVCYDRADVRRRVLERASTMCSKLLKRKGGTRSVLETVKGARLFRLAFPLTISRTDNQPSRLS